jgi:hypothetical protein
MKQHTDVSIYSYREKERERERERREEKGSVKKHSGMLIDDDSDHISMVPVTDIIRNSFEDNFIGILK